MASGSNVTLNVGANLNPANLVRQLNQVQAQHGTFNMTLNTKGFQQPLGRITGDLGEFQNALDASIARTLAFGAAVGVVNGVANAFKTMVSSAIDVEKKLADINVILNESQKGLADFSNKLFEVAKNTGQSFDAVSDAAVELARQGLGAEETLKRINDAMILTRLSGMDAAKSVETLTAAVNGFGQSAITTTQLVNKLATVDAAFAVSTEDLANALSRAGSSAQAAKVDLNQLLAAVTSVQQQTARGGAVIGNAFKSIFTRLQRSGVREALEEIGVATTDAAGNIRGAMSILKDYAGVYSSLTDQQRAYTDELVAGVFQINNLKALVKDLGSGFSIYDRALSQSANATDEATRRNRALGETLSSLVNEAVVNVKALAASLGNLVATPAIQNLLKMFNSISEALVKALDPEQGSRLIKGMFTGIGNFIAGPGLIIVGAAFVKLFKFITGQSVRALKEVFKINTAAQKTKQIEAELAVILANNTQLYQQISNQSLTRQQREQMVLNAINAETVAYKQQAVILAQLARSRVVGAGVGARSRAGAGGRSRAGGFVPNYVNEVEGAVASERAAVSAGVGGASQGAQAKVLPGFPVGGGRKETMVANTDEVIAPNFGGGEGSAIFNPDMIKTMGMPEGAVPVSGGFVPNFALTPAAAVVARRKGAKNAAKKKGDDDGALTREEKQQIVRERINAYLGGMGGPSFDASDVAQSFGIIASAGTTTKSGKAGGTGNTLGLGADSSIMKGAFRNDKGLITTDAQSKLAKKLGKTQKKFTGIAQTPIMPISQAQESEVEKEAKEGRVAPIDFESIIGKPIANAIGNISSTMYSRLLGDDATKGDILKGIKSNIEANSADYAKSGGKILSAGAEGAMLELAVRFGAKGAQKTIGAQSDTAIWDFEEQGPIDKDVKSAFFKSDRNMARADGKRSGGDTAWRSALQKSVNDSNFIPQKYSPKDIFAATYNEEVQNILTGNFGGKSRRGKRGRQVGDSQNIIRTTKGSASGFIPNFAEKGLPQSTADAEKSAEKVKKEINQLSIDWGDIVIGTKKLKKESSFDVVQPRGTTGIRGASGFIPSFASALEESITREKDTLAAQGSDAKVYTGQDDRLKGPKNPAGLLVANTRDEPRSGSQGVDRMLSAGRNPKTGGSAEGYVPNFVGPAAIVAGAGKVLGGIGAAFSKLATTLFAVEIALSVLNPILEQYGYQTIPTITDGIKILLDRFFGVDRAMVNLAETARKTAETEIKALTQSIEKVDGFTSSVSKLSNAIDAGNVDTMGEFLKSTLEQANKVENIDLGSIFENLGDQQAMSKAAEDIKAAASAEVSLKQLGGELAAISKKFQETRAGARNVGDALKKTGNSYKNLSKSLIAGQSLEDMKSSLDRMNKSAAIGSSGVRQLADTFPELSHESAMFIATTGDMGPKLAKATKQQLRYQIAVAELTKQMEESAGKVPEIKNFGDDLVRLGEGITSASNATVSAINSLNEVGSIEAASRVEGLQATGTVSKGAVLQGTAAGESTRARDKALQDQNESLEKFGAEILKNNEGDGVSLEGPLKALVEGIASGNTNAAASLGVLEEISKGSGANADTAKATINELIKINTTQISSQAKIEATLRANLDKLNNQAVAFQRNNVLSQQQIDQFSEFSNTLNKDGETEKSQLQKLTELKGVMSTVESLIGDDDVLAELKEQTSQLTQLENLRGTFEALTGQEFDGGNIRELQGQIESFISRGQTQDLDPIKKDLFYALKEALDTAVSVGQPGVSTAGDVEAAATVKIDPTSLAELSAKMSQAIGEESAAALGVNSDILQSLNTSLEKNVGEIAASIAQQSIDNEAGIKKRNEINEKISKILKESLGGLELTSEASSLATAAAALEVAADNLKAGTSASGFVPNFSPQNPIARAANTERAMGGRPVVDHQKGVGTYVRDGKTQKNFSDVRRDHPEGIGRAIKNSRSIQGAGAGFVPNFAGITPPNYIPQPKKLSAYYTAGLAVGAVDRVGMMLGAFDDPFDKSSQSAAFMAQRAYGQPPPSPADLFDNYLNKAPGKAGQVSEDLTGASRDGWYQQYGSSSLEYSVEDERGINSKEMGRAELYYGPIAGGKPNKEAGFVELMNKWNQLANNFETAGAIVPGDGQAGGGPKFAKIYSGGFSPLQANQISAQSRTVLSPYSDDEFLPTLPYIFPPKYENYYNNASHAREAADRNGNSPAAARLGYTSNPIISSNAGAFEASAFNKLKMKYESEFAGGESSRIGLISQMEGSEGFISAGRGVTLQTFDQEVAGQQNQNWGGWVPFTEQPEVNVVEMLRSANRLGDLENLFKKLTEPIPNEGRLNIPIPKSQHTLWDDYRNLRAIRYLGYSATDFNPDNSSLGAPIWKKDSLLARAYGMFEADKFGDKFSGSDDAVGFYIPVGGLKPTQDGYESNEDLTPWTLSQLHDATAQNEINKTKLREKLARGGLDAEGNHTDKRSKIQLENLDKFGAQLNKYIPFYESTKASASEGVYPKELGHPFGNAWSSNAVRDDTLTDDPYLLFNSGLGISRTQPQNVLTNTQEGFTNRLKENDLAAAVKGVLSTVPSLEKIQEARATWTNREERARDQEVAYEVIRKALLEEAAVDAEGLPVSRPDVDTEIDWVLPDDGTQQVLDQFEENLNLPPIPQIPEVQEDQTPASLVRDNVYKALLQKPVDLVGDDFEKRRGRALIDTVYSYKKAWAKSRERTNRQLSTNIARRRDFPNMSAKGRKELDDTIRAQEKKMQVLQDPENGLAYLFGKGSGEGIPNPDDADFWNETVKDGARPPDFTKEALSGGKPRYQLVLDKYFNGLYPQGDSASDAGDSLFGGTGQLGSTMTADEYLRSFHSYGIMDAGGTSEIIDFAKARGFGGETLNGLDGSSYKSLVDTLYGKSRGTVADQFIGGGQRGRKQMGESAETLFKSAGGIELSDIVQDVRNSLNGEIVYEEVRKKIREVLLSSAGDNNPRAKYVIDNLSFDNLMKSSIGKSLMNPNYSASAPVWDFSNMFGGAFEAEVDDVDGQGGMQTYKAPALGENDLLQIREDARRKVMEKWEKSNNPNRKKGDTAAGAEGWLSSILTNVSKESAEQYAPYVASLNKSNKDTLFNELLTKKPRDGAWLEKYANLPKLLKYSGSPEQSAYGPYNPYKKGEGGNALTEDQVKKGKLVVSSINQGSVPEITSLLYTGGDFDPFQLDSEGADPQTAALSPEQAKEKLIKELADYSKGLGAGDLSKKYAPFGYIKKGIKTPTGVPGEVKDWLATIKGTTPEPAPEVPEPPVASRGFVPNFSAIAGEIAASQTAGYKTPVTAGQVKTMNIPGAGKTAYNTQESVFRKPGVSQPFIAPPSNSKAASGYKKAVQSKFNFDPYGSAASGFVPNFAGMDMTLLTEASYTILEAAKIFGDHSKSIEDSAKVLADAGVQMGQKYTDNIRPLTAATKSLMNSIAGISIPDSIEVSAGTLGSQMSALSSALGNVSGQIAVEVNVPDVSVQVAADSAGEQISTTIVEIMQQVIPGIVKAQLNTEEARNIITAEVNKELGLSG